MSHRCFMRNLLVCNSPKRWSCFQHFLADLFELHGSVSEMTLGLERVCFLSFFNFDCIFFFLYFFHFALKFSLRYKVTWKLYDFLDSSAHLASVFTMWSRCAMWYLVKFPVIWGSPIHLLLTWRLVQNRMIFGLLFFFFLHSVHGLLTQPIEKFCVALVVICWLKSPSARKFYLIFMVLTRRSRSRLRLLSISRQIIWALLLIILKLTVIFFLAFLYENCDLVPGLSSYIAGEKLLWRWLGRGAGNVMWNHLPCSLLIQSFCLSY